MSVGAGAASARAAAVGAAAGAGEVVVAVGVGVDDAGVASAFGADAPSSAGSSLSTSRFSSRTLTRGGAPTDWPERSVWRAIRSRTFDTSARRADATRAA